MQGNMICFADFCGYTKNSGNSVQVSSDISCLICLRVSVCSAVINVALVQDSVQLTFTETPLLSVSVSPEVIHVCVSHSVFFCTRIKKTDDNSLQGTFFSD